MVLDDVFPELLGIVSRVGAGVDIPIESEKFFSELVCSFPGSRSELLTHVEENLNTWFRKISPGPDWLQEAEWQFSNGRPMVFVGQLDIQKESGYFHDDARVFLFWDPERAETKSVFQVS